MPRGDNLHPLFRSSSKRYTERPPANCVTAREAWDLLTLKNPDRGGIVCLFLHDGYWQAEFADGEWDDAENVFGANRSLRRREGAKT
jgi:hypothetical protein